MADDSIVGASGTGTSASSAEAVSNMLDSVVCVVYAFIMIILVKLRLAVKPVKPVKAVCFRRYYHLKTYYSIGGGENQRLEVVISSGLCGICSTNLTRCRWIY